MQERGIAEAEHKPEGMLSKTFGLLKVFASPACMSWS